MELLRITNLSKTYPGKDPLVALKDINLSYEENKIIGLLGNNGAGKTTLLKCIVDIVKADSGEIYIKDTPLNKINQKEKASKIFFVAEGTRSLWWKLTLFENIRFLSKMMWDNWEEVKNKIDPYLEILKLSEKKHSLVGELSRGQQQKICILLAMVSPSYLIILDEPSLGLDVSSRDEIAQMILMAKEESKNKTFLISSHDMTFISRIADQVTLLKDGQVIANGSIEELNKLNSKNTLRFTLASEIGELERNYIEKKYNSRLLEKDGKLYFDVEASSKIKKEIIDYLSQKDIEIKSMENKDMDLESLFVEIQRNGGI